MKKLDISMYGGIECVIYSFSHDVYGNPTAHFAVYAYKWNVQQEPSKLLYQSKRRQQVSYAGTNLAYAKDAFQLCGIDCNELVYSHESGERSEDKAVIEFNVIKKA